MFSFLYHRQDFCQTRLHIWASQRVSYKMQKVRSIREHLDSLMGFGGVHIAHHFGFVYCVELCCVFLYFVLVCLRLRVILHQFWVKKLFPSKFNLEYGGILTKLFMHVSSRNMFPTTRNLQIRVHVYRPRHCCGDWLTFDCFVPMIADHDLVKKS